MSTSTPSTPITATTGLTRRWHEILSAGGGPGDPSARTMWVVFFDADDVQLSVIIPIDDTPALPEPGLADGLAQACHTVLARECSGMGSVAMAFERPGAARATAADRAWERELTQAAARHDVALRCLHIAGPGWVMAVDGVRGDG